jgi:hypothetical protein
MEILAERAEADRGSRTRESGLLQSSLRRLGKLRFDDPLYGTQPAAVAFGGVRAFRKEQNRRRRVAPTSVRRTIAATNRFRELRADPLPTARWEDDHATTAVAS